MKLHRHETLDVGLTRIAADLLERAVGHLTDTDASPLVRVHETRKRCKEIRAILRVGREGLDGDFLEWDAAYGDVARELAAVREADALQGAVRSLRAATRDPLEWRALTQVSRLLVLDQPSARMDFDRLVNRLPAVSFSMKGTGWFRRGLRRTYRNGRRAFRQARQTPNAELIHQWRKRVKDLWYVTQIVSPVWPELMEAPAKTLHDLSRLLGDHHDVWLLDLHVAHNRSRSTALRVAAVAERRLAQLEREIFAKGAVVYADSPRAWSRNIVD